MGIGDFLGNLFGGRAEREAAEKNRALTAQYQSNALGALGDAYGQGTGYLKQGISAYDPLAALGTKYNAAGDVWMGSLGVGGDAQRAAATNAFETTPGYKIAQAAAEEGIARRRAISGGYNAGQTDLDLGNQITSMLYKDQYAPWQAQLQNAAQMGGAYTGTAAAGQAGGYGSLANLAQQYGQSQTNVYGNATNNNIAANNQQAAGEAAGAKNLLGAGLGLASMAFGGGGGGLLGGGGGGMLGGLFGGGSSMNSSPWSFPMATTGGNWGRPMMG